MAESILQAKQAACDARRAAHRAKQASQPANGAADDVSARDAYEDDLGDAVDYLMSQDSPRAASAGHATETGYRDRSMSSGTSSRSRVLRGPSVTFSHIVLKQRYHETILEAAFSRGLNTHHLHEIEATLKDIRNSRPDGRLSIQDLLDALADFMELDYSCSDLTTKPAMLPAIIGLAPHIADIAEFLDDDEDIVRDNPAAVSPRNDSDDDRAAYPRDDDDDDDDESGEDDPALGEDEQALGEDGMAVTDDEESGDDDESSDEESGDEEESSDDEDTEDEDPRGPC